MFWDSLKSIFQKSPKKSTHVKAKTVGKGQPTGHRKVDPKHIGDLGEYKIHAQLRQFSQENRYLEDVLLPNPGSKVGYAQIDHILITPYGLFVIETKNYSGRIKGKRGDKTWSVNRKFDMYNPLRQNHVHMRVLKGILRRFSDLRFVSVVAFTKRCELYIDHELRDVESDEWVISDFRVTEYIEGKLRRFKRQMPDPPLSESDVATIFEVLSTQNITDDKIRVEHKQRVREFKAKN